MAGGSRLAEILDDLVDRWSARRALDPLRCLRAAWPSPLGVSDEWHALRRALRDVNDLEPGTLAAEEEELLGEAQRLLHRALRAVGDG